MTGPRSYGAPVCLTGVDDGRLPGIYVLLFGMAKETTITIGRLGKLSFPAGWYAYVGSGMNGVGNRVSRHLRPHERPHWHLDYLLPSGTAAAAIIGFTPDRLECQLAGRLGQRLSVFRRFGSSDCHCAGHLFHGGALEPIADMSLDAMRGLGCEPLVLAALADHREASGYPA